MSMLRPVETAETHVQLMNQSCPRHQPLIRRRLPDGGTGLLSSI